MHNIFSNNIGIGPFGMLGIFALGSIFVIIIGLALFALKGYSLWYAAKRDEKGWFIALLLINTMGLLEFYYLYSVVGLWKKKTLVTEEKKETSSEQGK